MTPRRLLILVTTVTAAMTLTACVPDPAPAPTPTGFASEEEAFAAAEETYRAYIDATNARNAGEEDADPRSYLLGEALVADGGTQKLLRETRRSFKGEYKLLEFTPLEVHQLDGATEVTATACIDSTAVSVVDKAGADVTPSDDVPIYTLQVALTSVGGELKISESDFGHDGC